MLRGLLTGLVTFVVLVLLVGLLGAVGGVEVGLSLLVSVVVGWLTARSARRRPVS